MTQGKVSRFDGKSTQKSAKRCKRARILNESSYIEVRSYRAVGWYADLYLEEVIPREEWDRRRKFGEGRPTIATHRSDGSVVFTVTASTIRHSSRRELFKHLRLLIIRFRNPEVAAVSRALHPRGSK